MVKWSGVKPAVTKVQQRPFCLGPWLLSSRHSHVELWPQGLRGPHLLIYQRRRKKSVALPPEHKSNATQQRLTTSPRPLTLCSRLPVVSDRWSPTPMETHTWKESRSELRNSKRAPFRDPRRIHFKLYFIYRPCLHMKCLPDEQLQSSSLFSISLFYFCFS